MIHSIIQKSQLEGALRLDAEYYCAFSDMRVKSLTGEKIVNFIQYGTSKDLNEVGKGYPVLRLNEFENYFVGRPTKYSDKISKSVFDSLSLKRGDVLITRTNGNPKLVGKAAMAMKDMEVAFASYLFRVRPNKNISPSCLTVFLNSSFGRKQIEKYLMPSIQSNFSPAKFREIKVPIFDLFFQKEIDDLFNKSYSAHEESHLSYQQAENLLLKELGLGDFDEESKLFSIVSLSDIQKVNRIDADYFLPKYEKLISEIKNKNSQVLGNLVSLTKGFEPGSEAYQEKGKLFIRVSSLSIDGLTNGDHKCLSEELYIKLRDSHEPQTGEILLTKDATPGIAFAVDEPIEGIISSGILRLKMKANVDIQYLALVLNSVVGRMQAERDAGGSIIAHWKPDQIRNILIPILPIKTQQKIAELVRKSHAARQKSKELLDEARRKVEEMIKGI